MNKQSPISFILISLIKIGAVIALVYFIYIIAIKAYDYGYRISNEPPITPGSDRYVEVTVLEGASVGDVAQMLEDSMLIQDKYIYMAQEWFSKFEGDMVPGVYELSPSMTGEEMIEIMAPIPEEEGE